MATATAENQTNGPASLAGRYLTFALGRESYGIGVLKIREIVRIMDVTSVPQLPPCIKGVVNLRGTVVPVVDLRLKFELSSAEATERTCILVAKLKTVIGGSALIGFIVDGVEDVINLSAEDIERTPDFGNALDTQYILGVARIKAQVKILLDVDRLVSAETIGALASKD